MLTFYASYYKTFFWSFSCYGSAVYLEILKCEEESLSNLCFLTFPELDLFGDYNWFLYFHVILFVELDYYKDF